jgi:lipoprotein signal peptidase
MAIRQHRARFLVQGVLAAGFVLADQLLKAWVDVHVRVFGSLGVPGLTPLFLGKFLNRGLASGLFMRLPDARLVVVTRYLPSAAFAVLTFLATARAGRERGERGAWVLLWAGCASNLLDSWRGLWVIDSLQLQLGGKRIPFNLADVCICVGAAWLALAVAFSTRPSGNPRAPSLGH